MEDSEPSAQSLEECIERVVRIEERDSEFVKESQGDSIPENKDRDAKSGNTVVALVVEDAVAPGVEDGNESIEAITVEKCAKATAGHVPKVVDDHEGQQQQELQEQNANPASEDSDSEDDLQLIVNDEDIFYPHGVEGGEDAEGEEIFVVGGDEHYDELDWAAEMHYHHSQFKYVRPGSGPASASPGIPDPTQTPGAKAVGPLPFPGYSMGMWDFHSFQPAYEFVLPPSKTVFDIDIDQFEEKPWDYEGTDVTDYFNFGFTEETWKQYCEEFARAKVETSKRSKMRGHENGHSQQGWNYDNARYNDIAEPQRGRSRGMRNHFPARVMDSGGNERSSSGELRRHRHRDCESVLQIFSQEDGRDDNQHGDFRRKQRNDDFTRRKGFTRQGQSGEQTLLLSSPLSGRLGVRTPPGPESGIYSSSAPSGGRSSYSTRSTFSSVQGSVSNGFRTLSKRLEEEEMTPKRSPPRVEKGSASDPQRRVNEPVMEKRSTPLVKRVSQLVNETRSSKVVTEKISAIERTPAVPVRSKTVQVVTERRAQLLSERRLLTERRAERKSEVTVERRSPSPNVVQEEKQPAKTLQDRSRHRLLARSTSLLKSEEKLKSKKQDAGVKDDLRMKVLEKVSARWKLHLRMDDAHARRKRENVNKPVDQKEVEQSAAGFSRSVNRDTKPKYSLETLEEETRDRRDDRKRRHKERREKRRLKSEDDDARSYEEYVDYYHDVDERWQMEDDFAGHEYRNDRKRKRQEKRYDEGFEIGEHEIEDLPERRSQRHSESRYRRREFNNSTVDTWEMEEGECEDDVYEEELEYEDDRWTVDESPLVDHPYAYKRKRRRYNDEVTDGDRDYDIDAPLNDERDYSYEGSLSAQAEEYLYKGRDESYHRETDRWTGTLYDSCDEYDEYCDQ